MSASTASLAYCTNVHPAETLAGIWEALRTHAIPLKRLAAPDRPLGVGLYLPEAAAEPLALRTESAGDFRAFLREEGLEVRTANAFPIGCRQGCSVRTDSKGVVYVFFEGAAFFSSAQMMVRSFDGGVSFAPETSASSQK